MSSLVKAGNEYTFTQQQDISSQRQSHTHTHQKYCKNRETERKNTNPICSWTCKVWLISFFVYNIVVVVLVSTTAVAATTLIHCILRYSTGILTIYDSVVLMLISSLSFPLLAFLAFSLSLSLHLSPFSFFSYISSVSYKCFLCIHNYFLLDFIDWWTRSIFLVCQSYILSTAKPMFFHLIYTNKHINAVQRRCLWWISCNIFFFFFFLLLSFHSHEIQNKKTEVFTKATHFTANRLNTEHRGKLQRTLSPISQPYNKGDNKPFWCAGTIYFYEDVV